MLLLHHLLLLRGIASARRRGSESGGIDRGNVESLEVKWTFVYPNAIQARSQPAFGGGAIYFGSQDDHLYAVSPKGKVLWRYELPGDFDASVAIAADSTLIVGCDDGFLRALLVTPK